MLVRDKEKRRKHSGRKSYNDCWTSFVSETKTLSMAAQTPAVATQEKKEKNLYCIITYSKRKAGRLLKARLIIWSPEKKADFSVCECIRDREWARAPVSFVSVRSLRLPDSKPVCAAVAHALLPGSTHPFYKQQQQQQSTASFCTWMLT